MPTPVLEDIAEQIVARIEAQADGPYKVKRVVRPNKRQSTLKALDHLECALIQGDLERVPDEDNHGNPNAAAFNVTYSAIVFIAPSDNDENAIDTYVNYVTAELCTALTTGSGGIDWAQWNNKAKNSTLDPGTASDASGMTVAVVVMINVQLHMDETDFYTAR